MNFSTNVYTRQDNYMTPKSAWEDIQQYLPTNKVIWDPFYLNGVSGRYLEELGCTVIHENVDFFTHDMGDMIVSNPPFTLIPKILKRLVHLDKPFILIMPCSKLNTQYFRNTFRGLYGHLQIIIPKKRLQFVKIVNDSVPLDFSHRCNFDCFYYTYKCNLPSDIVWLP